MDRITKSLVQDLLKSLEISSNGDSEDFEKFSAYSILSKEYTRTFEIDSISTGGGNDTGIDAIAILVNGHLIENRDEIDDLIERNSYLDVTFIFVQSKTTSSFELKEMNNFYFGVKDFFSESPKLIRNDEIGGFSEISDCIFSKASYLKKNPECKLFYVTTGSWSGDKNLMAANETVKEELDSLNLFSKISVVSFGAREICEAYRKSRSKVSAEFTFSERVTLPELEGIEEAFYGIVDFKEFRKLLVDENANLQNIFEDNVRDFQGEKNPVNATIAQTLESETPNLFCVLNNGVTIVANSLKTSGNKFVITDYQIVNGCQTSNVLFNHIESEYMKDLSIPLKLIVTSNEDIKNKITLATNSQTAIKREQLTALTVFQRELEHFYNAIEGQGKLYYERRAKQYENDGSITKTRIITIPIQIKAFSSMFLGNPHMVTSYFGQIVRKIENSGYTIFDESHNKIYYYTSGLAYYRLESLFRSGQLDRRYKKIRFYMMMGFRILSNPIGLPQLNAKKKSEVFCKPIIEALLDDSKSLNIFNEVIELIFESGIDFEDKQSVKAVATTQSIVSTFIEKNKIQQGDGHNLFSPASPF